MAKRPMRADEKEIRRMITPMPGIDSSGNSTAKPRELRGIDANSSDGGNTALRLGSRPVVKSRIKTYGV